MPSIDEATIDEAVLSARELFWRRGYDDTSIEDIVTATGLNRYAIYNAFGGKLELFLAALDNYHAARETQFLSILGDPSKRPIDAIRGVVETCISDMAKRKAGCLMCSVALEVGRHDSMVMKHVNEYLGKVRTAYEMALTQAEQRGELNPIVAPGEAAALLISNMLGASTMAHNGANQNELLSVFDSLIALLSQKVQKVPKKIARNVTQRRVVTSR